jgi:D-tyrosyl-tRNA(Tyr) deacylase
MRAVIQRVSSASVTVAGEVVAQISEGMLVLLGVRHGDTPDDAVWLAQKVGRLRIFEDSEGKMNLAIGELAKSAPPDAGQPPQILVVSQFTLLASTRKGTRPSFNDAAKPDEAIPLYETFVRLVAAESGCRVVTGKFGAMMDVALVNDGPVTLVIDSVLRE